MLLRHQFHLFRRVGYEVWGHQWPPAWENILIILCFFERCSVTRTACESTAVQDDLVLRSGDIWTETQSVLMEIMNVSGKITRIWRNHCSNGLSYCTLGQLQGLSQWHVLLKHSSLLILKRFLRSLVIWVWGVCDITTTLANIFWNSPSTQLCVSLLVHTVARLCTVIFV